MARQYPKYSPKWKNVLVEFFDSNKKWIITEGDKKQGFNNVERYRKESESTKFKEEYAKAIKETNMFMKSTAFIQGPFAPSTQRPSPNPCIQDISQIPVVQINDRKSVIEEEAKKVGSKHHKEKGNEEKMTKKEYVKHT